MWNDLIKDLKQSMSLTRLAKIGLFQRLPHGDEEIYKEHGKEIHLHRIVLDRALVDYFSFSKRIKKDVDDWLYIDNPGFIESCERALLDPKAVYVTFKIMKKILKGKNAEFRQFKERNKHSKNK